MRAAAVYRVDAAPPGRVCDAAVHGDAPVVALVRTGDDSEWCAIHWWLVLSELERDGHHIAYTHAALVVLGMRKT